MSTRDTRHCPKCGSAMSYRLGEYDCQSCGHTEVAAAAPKEEAQWGRSSDSVNRARLISPPGTAPPPPGSYNLGGLPPEDMYSSAGAGHKPVRDSLHTEKIVFMVIQGGSVLVVIIALLSLGSMAPELGGAGGGAVIGSLLVAALINLALYGLVLFSDAIWLKWSCLGCQTIALIGAFVAMFTPDVMNSGMAGGGVAGRIFQFVFLLWFASIVYRDVMRHQEY